MKVRELIAVLQAHDPESEVRDAIGMTVPALTEICRCGHTLRFHVPDEDGPCIKVTGQPELFCTCARFQPNG